MDKKASGKALLPFGIFVGIYLATGMILNFQGVEMAFYQLPAPVAAILGILVNLGMSVMPPQFIAAGAFVISAFIALATGTSVGYCDSYDTDYHWLGRSWWN